MSGSPAIELVPFARYVGVEVTEAAAGTAIAVLPQRPELMNHLGLQHAGALYTVAETASGAAMISGLGNLLTKAVPVVRSSSTAFQKRASGPVKAAAKMTTSPGEVAERFRANGKADFFVEVSLTDGTDVVVASMTFEWSLRVPRTA